MESSTGEAAEKDGIRVTARKPATTPPASKRLRNVDTKMCAANDDMRTFLHVIRNLLSFAPRSIHDIGQCLLFCMRLLLARIGSHGHPPRRPVSGRHLSPPVRVLLQRIVFDTHEIRGIVLCCRMRTAPLLIRDFFGARSAHQARMALISFDTTRLGVEPVRFLALPGEPVAAGSEARRRKVAEQTKHGRKCPFIWVMRSR
jgi:hypothetical protein